MGLGVVGILGEISKTSLFKKMVIVKFRREILKNKED